MNYIIIIIIIIIIIMLGLRTKDVKHIIAPVK